MLLSASRTGLKIAFIALIVLLMSSCGLPLAESPFGGKDGKNPCIPPEINRGAGKEPIISVFMAEEEVIEKMGLEEYLEGVVAGEMETNWPLEALAAQAIVSRTFTLQKIREGGGVPEKNAHASTDKEEFQAYSAENINDSVREAISLTRGLVACYHNEFVKAWFHAYAGPRTALADEGLAFEKNPPYIQIVESPGKKIIPPEEGNWFFNFPLEQVRAAVEEVTGNDPGVVENVQIGKKGPSGRAVTILVNGQEIEAPELRLALGSTEMRSTYLTACQVKDDHLILKGSGYGHGVGLCQWGARALAEEKKPPEEIINYFYKNVDIIKLWE